MQTDQLDQQLRDAIKAVADALDAAGIKGSVVAAVAMQHLSLSVLLGTLGPEKTREILQMSLTTIDECFPKAEESDLMSLLTRLKTHGVH